MPEISVIIPVYKVEPYLYRCLDSVLSQTFSDYECIIVNDGSPDKCPLICDEYALKDNRFRVIHKKHNEGLPKARKSGLDTAKGEFIFHLDSDDWLESDAFELLYKKQQETNADIVQAGMNIFYSFKIHKNYFPVFNNITVLAYYFLYNCVFIFGKLYRKKLIQNYILPEENVGEDIITTSQIFTNVSNGMFVVLDKIIYNYDRCAGGMSNNVYADHSKCIHYYDFPSMKVRLWVEEYLKDKMLTKNEQSAFQCYMIRNGINPYLKHSGKINKSDVSMFYHKYYINCIYKSKIRFRDRIILPIFYKSLILGRIYITFLNIGKKAVITIFSVLRKCFST